MKQPLISGQVWALYVMQNKSQIPACSDSPLIKYTPYTGPMKDPATGMLTHFIPLRQVSDTICFAALANTYQHTTNIANIACVYTQRSAHAQLHMHMRVHIRYTCTHAYTHTHIYTYTYNAHNI